MPNIQVAIERAAQRFALEVVNILRGATLSELQQLAGSGADGEAGGGARRGRRVAAAANGAGAAADGAARSGRRTPGLGRKRSPEEVSRLADRVLEFLRGAKQEVGVSAIAAGLKVPTADLALPLSRLKEAGKVRSLGRKRSTVYRLP